MKRYKVIVQYDGLAFNGWQTQKNGRTIQGEIELALTKINISRIRGKYSGTNLFGGGAPNYTELLSEGNEAVKELETKLYEGAPGFGDNAPPLFFIG